MLSRRNLMLSLTALGLFGCTVPKGASAEPGRGWILSVGSKILGSDFNGRSVLTSPTPFGPDAPFRIASITKLVVGLAIYDWAEDGVLDLDAPITDVFSNTPPKVTLRNLLSHRSGLKDPRVYWADIETDIETLFGENDFTHEPEVFFRYANLNYGLAATVIETRLQERFDLRLWKWLTGHGLDAGLNWSGVSPAKRKAAAALYRHSDNGDWAPTIDAPADIPLVSPTYLGRERAQLQTYEIGKNGTLFSPQGGLRMSLRDILKIGEILQQRSEFHRAVWTFDGKNGATESDHFLTFGPANYIYDEAISPIPGVPLIGHLGEAYGAYTGLFIVPNTKLIFAFASLGTPLEGLSMNGARANQSVEHQALFDALAPTLRAHI